MKVKALDDSHLLVILTAQEAGSLGLGAKVLREGADGCRAVMERLLAAACRQTGFSCERRRGKVGIHAMPTVEGEWVLVFSDLVMQKPPAACGEQLPKRRTYRIKECAGPYGYRFPSCEDALRVLERLFYENMLCPCQFIRLGEGYYLVAHPKRREFAALHCLMQEYGTVWGRGKAAAAFLLEHGHLLSPDAVRRVGACLAGRMQRE